VERREREVPSGVEVIARIVLIVAGAQRIDNSWR
jgi:hypothetical protein